MKIEKKKKEEMAKTKNLFSNITRFRVLYSTTTTSI